MKDLNEILIKVFESLGRRFSSETNQSIIFTEENGDELAFITVNKIQGNERSLDVLFVAIKSRLNSLDIPIKKDNLEKILEEELSEE